MFIRGAEEPRSRADVWRHLQSRMRGELEPEERRSGGGIPGSRLGAAREPPESLRESHCLMCCSRPPEASMVGRSTINQPTGAGRLSTSALSLQRSTIGYRPLLSTSLGGKPTKRQGQIGLPSASRLARLRDVCVCCAPCGLPQSNGFTLQSIPIRGQSFQCRPSQHLEVNENFQSIRLTHTN